MTYWILKDNGQVISTSTVIPLRNEQKDQYSEDMKRLDRTVAEKYAKGEANEAEVIDNDDMEDPITQSNEEQVEGGRI